MRTLEPTPAVHAVDRIVFRVPGVEEPEHALEATDGIPGGGELPAVLLVPGAAVGGVDREPARYADRIDIPLSARTEAERQPGSSQSSALIQRKYVPRAAASTRFMFSWEPTLTGLTMSLTRRSLRA